MNLKLQYLYLVMFTLIFASCSQLKKQKENTTSLKKQEVVQSDLIVEKLKGNVKSVSETTFQAVDTLGAIIKGNIVKMPMMKKEYYDELGYKTKKQYFNKDSILISEIFRNYDSLGRIIKEFSIDEDGGEFIKAIYSYNSAGKFDRINYLNRDKTIDSYFIFKYNEEARKKESYCYASNGKLLSNTSTELNFNSKEELNKIFKEGREETSIMKIYNESGHLIDVKYYKGKELLYEFKYEVTLDSFDNWIKRIEYQNGVVFQMTEREIIYYN